MLAGSVCICLRRSTTHFSRRGWLLRADLVLGLPCLGRCAGVRHGKLRPEGAGRSAVRAAWVASGNCVQNPLRGSQNAGLQRMPRKWAGCLDWLGKPYVRGGMAGFWASTGGPHFLPGKANFGVCFWGRQVGGLGGVLGSGCWAWISGVIRPGKPLGKKNYRKESKPRKHVSLHNT